MASKKTGLQTRLQKIPGLIGVIHLPPLGGSPGARDLHPAEALQKAGLWAVREAQALTRAGFEAIILENFGDIPFYKDHVPPETIASLSVIAAAVREATDLPLGINVLRNDARSALAIAAVTGCEFIRVNILSGVAATDQGWIDANAAELIRERNRLGVDVAILADAHVKHAKTFSSDDLELAIEELALRAGADGVIITGSTTGRFVEREQLERASRVSRRHQIPVFVGSGSTVETLPEIVQAGIGVIVGSALRKGGKAAQLLDLKRTRDFVKAYRLAVREALKGKSPVQESSKKPVRKKPVLKKRKA